MNATCLLSLALFVATARVTYGADGFKLEPNATVRLDFSNLPDTLATISSGQKQPARLTAQLPENYSRDHKFPLFVFINGGDGGRGDSLPLDRRTVGSNDFICVNLPLFKHTNDGALISMDDFSTLSRCYG